uniref:Protein phosphatase 1 regulatory subunit 22 n=1 Tax=Gongylonema pulchrum TaxID=637853 RepID=A0A183EFL0_9BILA
LLYSNFFQTIDFTQCRVDTIPDFSRFTQLKEIGLRQNLLTSINPRITVVGLIRLDLYDNQIEVISNLDELVNLEYLDMSYNRIKKIEGLSGLVISNLDELVNLEYLDMSYNRIKKIEGLSGLVNLRRLYLVHNKIDEIAGLESLTKLELLELGDNRIKASIQFCFSIRFHLAIQGQSCCSFPFQLENIGHLIDLRELYIGKNKIRKLENLENLKKLTVLSVPKKLTIIDAGNNKITNLDGLNHLEELTDLWVHLQLFLHIFQKLPLTFKSSISTIWVGILCF